MANKDQKRGNRETRKPKQAKAVAPVQVTTFASLNKQGPGPGKKS